MASHGEDYKRLARNTGFLYLRQLIVVLVGLYTSRVVLRTLGETDFGIYSIVAAVVIYLSFLKQALTNATYRFFTYDLGTGNEANLGKTFSMSMNVHLLLAALVVIILEIAGPIAVGRLNIPAERMGVAQLVFQFSLLNFVLEIIRTPYNSSIIAHEKMDFYAVTSIVEAFLKLGMVFLLMWIAWDKLILYALMMCAIAVLLFFWYRIYCLRHFPETHYHKVWDGSLVKQMLSYSGWSMLVNGADVTVQQTNAVYLNLFGGVSANAAIGVANQVSGQLNGLLSSFTHAFNPQIIKSYAAGERKYFMNLIFSTSKISYFLLFTVAFPVMVYIDFILRIWLGADAVPELTGIFTRLIFCYSLIDSFSAPLWQSVHATGNIRTHQILMSAIKILNIPASYIALRLGAPLYTVLAIWAGLNLVCDIVRVIYVKSLIGLPLGAYVRDVFGGILLVTALSVPLPLLYYFNAMHRSVSEWLSFPVFFLIFFVVYATLVWFIGLNVSEREMLKEMLKGKLRLKGQG